MRQVGEAGRVHRDHPEEDRCRPKELAHLNEVIRNPGRMFRHTERTVVQVRISTNDVRVLMVQDVVLLLPRLFLDRGVPAESRGMELPGFLQARSEEHTSELQSRFGISY